MQVLWKWCCAPSLPQHVTSQRRHSIVGPPFTQLSAAQVHQDVMRHGANRQVVAAEGGGIRKAENLVASQLAHWKRRLRECGVVVHVSERWHKQDLNGE